MPPVGNWLNKEKAALPDGRSVLGNARYERFAQGLARGKTQHDAYIWAGFSPDRKPVQVRSEASKLSRRPEIAARVVYLQGRQAERIGVTVDALVQELDDMLKLAKRVKHPAAGVGAILAKGKLLGLIVDRAEVEGSIRKPSRTSETPKQMTLAEWQEKFAPKPGETLQ
jgi:phage terminase small subunit